jgi:hypothetical protein
MVLSAPAEPLIRLREKEGETNKRAFHEIVNGIFCICFAKEKTEGYN